MKRFNELKEFISRVERRDWNDEAFELIKKIDNGALQIIDFKEVFVEMIGFHNDFCVGSWETLSQMWKDIKAIPIEEMELRYKDRRNVCGHCNEFLNIGLYNTCKNCVHINNAATHGKDYLKNKIEEEKEKVLKYLEECIDYEDSYERCKEVYNIYARVDTSIKKDAEFGKKFIQLVEACVKGVRNYPSHDNIHQYFENYKLCKSAKLSAYHMGATYDQVRRFLKENPDLNEQYELLKKECVKKSYRLRVKRVTFKEKFDKVMEEYDKNGGDIRLATKSVGYKFCRFRDYMYQNKELYEIFNKKVGKVTRLPRGKRKNS